MHVQRILPLALAFAAGIGAWPLAQQAVAAAKADTAPLTPAVIDLAALGHDDLPATSNPEMRARNLVTTASGTIGIQSGNIARHRHAHSDEVQYIIEGAGSMWLGDARVPFKPGTLIVIPRGTAHGGSLVAQGPVKAIAIKLPPAAPGDTEFQK